MRTCSSGVFKRAGQVGRPCLLGYIDKCSAPCVGRVTPEEHQAIAEDFCDFMAGNTAKFVKRLERRMREASASLDFEQAARLRDDIGALNKALEKSAVVLGDGTDADVFALADDELEAAVQVFHVRGGRVRGQRGWVAEKDAESVPEIVEHLLQQVYGGESGEGVPREVLVPVLPPDLDAVVQWLSGLRGSQVDLRVPQRGDKRTLMETVKRNADQSLARHKLARAGDLTAAARRCRSCSRPSTWWMLRCGSSASTSATSRGPRSWRPWWSSRTGWRASPSTAASSCGDGQGPRTAPHRSTTRRP